VFVKKTQGHIEVREKVERIEREIRHRVVLMGGVHRHQRCRLRRVGDRGPVEGDPEDRQLDSDEALEYSAVGSVGVGDEHEADR